MKTAAFQQLQVKLETDHSHCSELLQKSLVAAGIVSLSFNILVLKFCKDVV